MKITILLAGIILALTLLLVSSVHAQNQGQIVAISDPTPLVVVPQSTSTPTLKDRIQNAALIYGVSYVELYNTLKCESGLTSTAIGDGGHSYGIAQIYLPAHPEITKKQALDADWAINWAAEQFSLGRASLWTCHRMLY